MCTFRPTKKINSLEKEFQLISSSFDVPRMKNQPREAFLFCGKKKNRIQKWAFLLSFSSTKQKNNFRLTYPFLFPFSEGNKEGILNHALLFPLSEESIKGIQNDWFLFSFSEGNNKGIQNNAILFPFSEESEREFSMMNFFSFSLQKTKWEIEFACTLQVALFPGSPHWQTGPGNKATLQEYPVALD